jgi:hypothetical protein
VQYSTAFVVIVHKKSRNLNMAILFWLFLLFSPIMWITAFVILLVKRRPLTFLYNFMLCAIIIYLLWAGIGTPEPEAASTSVADDLGTTASAVVEGFTKGFISLLLAAGWGMSILIYSALCGTAPKPGMALPFDRFSDRTVTSSAPGRVSPAGIQPAAARGSHPWAYVVIGVIILYLLAKKATEMGL